MNCSRAISGDVRRGYFSRTNITTVDASKWVYAYDSLGQVTSGRKVWADGTPVAGMNFDYAFDDDGNETGDGTWTRTWDGENRLRSMEKSSQKLEFAYDYLGRRIQKQVYSGSPGSWTLSAEYRFVYDGWNLMAVLNGSLGLVQHFYWGLDLSGTMQGAGGVGGLLWARFGPAPQFAAYDGNGNVMALVHAGVVNPGMITAQYEYGPFGELLKATGTRALDNPFRFSTKYQDDETGQLYYGYRFYSASVGRWPNRDPIGEKGGRNLYGFVGNNPVGLVDGDGRFVIVIPAIVIAVGVGVGIGICANNICCRIHRNSLFAQGEGEAHRNAPDESLHRPTIPGRQVVEGGDADALTHCISACNMAKDPGCCGGLDRALDWLQRREVGNEIGTQLDRINNENGFAIGMGNPASCTQACLDALCRGLLNEISNGVIVPSSCPQ